MELQFKLALTLARSPLHGVLRKAHRKLDRYVELAENWNNPDPETNGESFLIRTAAPHLKVAFDIGANLGTWTSLLLTANPDCAVYAFEASPRTFDTLQSHLRGRRNVSFFQTGLGEECGKFPFHDHGENSGLSSFISREKSVGIKAERIIEVGVTTVDAICASHGLDQVDFIKVDTEGYEMAVMRGMKGCLALQKISAIQFEYGGTWLDAGEALANAAELFRGYGYQMYRLRQKSLEKILYDCREHECFKYSNFLAVVLREILARWRIPTMNL